MEQETSVVVRYWSNALGISILGVINVTENSGGLEQIVTEYKEVFKNGLGMYRDPDIKIEEDPNIFLIFLKVRRIPYAIYKKIWIKKSINLYQKVY